MQNYLQPCATAPRHIRTSATSGLHCGFLLGRLRNHLLCQVRWNLLIAGELHRIVALAGGSAKTRAIRAILSSGLLFGLITDEATARRLVNSKPGREPGKKNGRTAPG